MLLTDQPPFAVARPGVRAAVVWAAELHASQRRDVDEAPFILHPLEVAALLSGRGYDDEVVEAGVLHDVVEDTRATIEDVRRRFGSRVATIVAAVTEDATIADFGQRKAALREKIAGAGSEANAVYAADKIVKVRELRAHVALDHASLGRTAFKNRLEHYEHSLDVLREVAPDQPMVEQLAFELWALRTLPPG